MKQKNWNGLNEPYRKYIPAGSYGDLHHPKKSLPKEEGLKEGTIKILSEKEEMFINLEVEMSDEVREALLEYADQYMTTKEDQDIRVNWAFVDIIKRHINKMEKTDGKKTKTKAKATKA